MGRSYDCHHMIVHSRALIRYQYNVLLSSSDRKYPPFPLQSYFPLLCACDICYITFCQLLHIHSDTTGNLFSLLLCSLWWVQIVGYVLDCRSYSFFVQCTISLWSWRKPFWRHWIYKMPVTYIFVECARLSILYQLSIIQYVGLHAFSLPISPVMNEIIYIFVRMS